MASQLLQHYVKLTEFLGHALGPDYEVALHDLTDKNRSIIAIANSHVSGRELGAPLTNTALKILRDRSYESQDYLLHYRGVSAGGKTLRSSTFFIKQNGRLIGMLCARPRLRIAILPEDVGILLTELDGAEFGDCRPIGHVGVALDEVEALARNAHGLGVPPALIGCGALDEHGGERDDTGEHGGEKCYG